MLLFGGDSREFRPRGEEDKRGQGHVQPKPVDQAENAEADREDAPNAGGNRCRSEPSDPFRQNGPKHSPAIHREGWDHVEERQHEVDEEKQLQKMLTSRREALKTAETELEKRKSEAAEIVAKLDGYRREAEAAQKSSLDALKLKNDRDAVARELEASNKDVATVRRDLDGLKRQLANDSEEQKKAEQKLLELSGTIKQVEAARSLAEKLAIEKRMELNQLSSDLTAAQADLSRVDAMRRSTNLTEADFQRVQRSKMEAEKEVAEQKADLNDLQRRVGEARATLKATVDELTKIQNSSPRE